MTVYIPAKIKLIAKNDTKNVNGTKNNATEYPLPRAKLYNCNDKSCNVTV